MSNRSKNRNNIKGPPPLPMRKEMPTIICKSNPSSVTNAISLHSYMVFRRNYHKFIIVNGASLKKEQVLSTIVKLCLPDSITPIKYVCNENKDGNSSFLSSNCWNAIKTLCLNNLTVTIPETNVQFEVIIKFDYLLGEDDKSPVNVSGEVARYAARLKKIYDGYLSDCSYFEYNPDLGDYYFALWAPQYQGMLCDLLKNITNLTHLNLSHNQIQSLSGFTKLYGTNLIEIDLSHNKIEWSELKPLHSYKLKSLWLDGNPLCSVPLAEYIIRIKALYPNLNKLDGELINTDEDTGLILKNGCTDTSALQLVDHFLHHYFKWFLMPEGRKSMIQMYHSQATLSLSCHFQSSIDSSITMNFFKDMSRNILKITNYAKACRSFTIDSSLIVFCLTSFPFVQLDPINTTVDVPYYLENKVIQICMNGIFRDRSHFMYWMNFTFVLQANNDLTLREWKITNQLISVMPASPQQCRNAFKCEMTAFDTSSFDLSKDEMLIQFKELTSLKPSYCQELLESTDWDLESALQSFVDQYKGDFIADSAFLS